MVAGSVRLDTRKFMAWSMPYSSAAMIEWRGSSRHPGNRDNDGIASPVPTAWGGPAEREPSVKIRQCPLNRVLQMSLRIDDAVPSASR